MPLLALCLQVGRRRRTGHDGQSSKPRVMLQTPWFADLVGERKLQGYLSTVNRRAADQLADQCPCDIIVNVARGLQYEGPLTPWTDEEELLWENLGRPQGAMSLRIKQSVRLQRAAIVQRPAHLKIPIWSPVAAASGVHLSGFDLKDPGRVPQILEEAGLSKALQVSADELSAFLCEPVCLAVPPVILELIRKGVWSHLMLCAYWRERRRGKAYHIFAAKLMMQHFHQEMKRANTLNRHVPYACLPFSQSDALTLAKNLKKWAPDILGPSQDDDAFAEMQLFLEEFVLKLQSFGGRTQVTTSAVQRQLDHDTVVKALCCSMGLRSKKDLSPMLCGALQNLFPGMDLDMEVKIPSGSTLSRKQLFVDAAYSCYWRDLLREHVGPLYLWADSSPQGGSDWLLSIVSMVKQEELEAVAQAADFLLPILLKGLPQRTNAMIRIPCWRSPEAGISLACSCSVP